jgi:outer membrane protein TolC
MAVNGMRLGAWCGAALLVVAPAATGAPAAPLRLGLRETVERAVVESHLVKAGAIEVERAGQGVRKARALRVLPEATVNVGTGLTPEARGNVVYSPDAADDLDSLGPYYRLELRLVQPLWTFGKLDAAETLALKGVAAQEARSALTGQSVAFGAAKAYWALAAAARGDTVAADMRKDFDELQREVEKRLKDETSGVDDADLLEVKSKAYGIERLYLDALEIRRLSADSLRVLLALPAESEPSAVDEPPPAVAIYEAGFS